MRPHGRMTPGHGEPFPARPGADWPCDDRRVPSPGYIRRRRGGVLVVGRVEPEVQPWLRGAGHDVRAVPDAAAAVAALDEEPADLVVAGRGGRRPRRGG